MSKIRLVEEGVYEVGRKPESLSERVQRLQAEAKMLAREQMETFQAELKRIAEVGREIAAGGDSYPAGIRDMVGRLADDIADREHSLDALVERAFGPSGPPKTMLPPLED